MSLGSVNVGSGDMYSAVYDPAGGERQVAFADELIDKMDKVNPTGSGYMTIGTRAEESTAGDGSVAIGEDVIASGAAAIAFGHETKATGQASFAIGAFAEANGQNSFAAGSKISGHDPSKAGGTAAVALGGSTNASGNYAMATGYLTEASGPQSLAEGYQTTASGAGSHTEGRDTVASGQVAHAEGRQTTASGDISHSEGRYTEATGQAAHAEGIYTIAAKPVQHAAGLANVEDTGSVTGHYPAPAGNYIEIVGNGVMDSSGTVTKRSNARTLDWDGNERLHGDLYVNCEDDSTGGSKVATETEVADKMDKVNPTGSGYMTLGTRAEGSTAGERSLVIGEGNTASGNDSVAIGIGSSATGRGAVAVGSGATATGVSSFAVGARIDADHSDTTASGNGAFAAGSSVVASGGSSSAIGYNNTAGNTAAFATGYGTSASGQAAHSEGISTTAAGTASHAEGNGTTVAQSADAAHAEGRQTSASAKFSHAEGLMTEASGNSAHSEGHRTIAAKPAQHVSGIANVADEGTTSGGHFLNTDVGSYIEIVGNGTTNASGNVTKRSNARTLDWDGNERLHGDLYVNCEDDSTGGEKVATENDLSGKMDKVNPTGSGYMTLGTRAEGSTVGERSVAIGEGVEASGKEAIAFGYQTVASGQDSVAIGAYGTASGQASLVMGTRVTGNVNLLASGSGAVAIGASNQATGTYAVATGYVTTASGSTAHAEGNQTAASGPASHAEGVYTKSSKPAQHASGIANVEDTGTTSGHYPSGSVGSYIEIVGNGEVNSSGTVTKRSNARTLDWSGNERLHGDLYVNCEDDSTGGSKVATETQVNAKYTKPSSGIPASDLASAVQTSLGYADTFNTVKPDGATAQNKLVTASQMGDAIEAVEAKQLYATNVQGSFATKAALTGATVFYNAAGTVATPTKNDVAYVLADESHGGKSAKYAIANEPTSSSDIVWGFVITFSDTTFSQAQMDAINSGINETKRSGYDSHVASTVIHVPVCTTADNGKFLRVVNGVPAWVSIPTMEGGSY